MDTGPLFISIIDKLPEHSTGRGESHPQTLLGTTNVDEPNESGLAQSGIFERKNNSMPGRAPGRDEHGRFDDPSALKPSSFHCHHLGDGPVILDAMVAWHVVKQPCLHVCAE